MRRARGARQRGGLPAKRVAEPVRGPDERRGAGVVAERLANLGDEVREVGLGDEGVRPETVLQHGLGQDFRTIQHEHRQQLERLGREVNLAVCPRVSCRVSRSRVNGPKRILTTDLLEKT